MEPSAIQSALLNLNSQAEFECDEIGQTWGVSYIRVVVAQISSFQSIEHFFVNSLFVGKSYCSNGFGEKSWYEGADLEKWASGLKIESTTQAQLLNFIDLSIKEHIEEHQKYNHDVFMDINKIPLIENIKHSWVVEETLEPRHYINWTKYYLGANESYYILGEGHWES